jgi:hypothetical protein
VPEARAAQGIGALAIAREHQLWKIIPPPTSDCPYNSDLYEQTNIEKIVSGHLIASYDSQDFSSPLWRLPWEFKGTLAMRLSRYTNPRSQLHPVV